MASYIILQNQDVVIVDEREILTQQEWSQRKIDISIEISQIDISIEISQIDIEISNLSFKDYPPGSDDEIIYAIDQFNHDFYYIPLDILTLKKNELQEILNEMEAVDG
jgi:predicted ATPase